jgi:hypothetical protein
MATVYHVLASVLSVLAQIHALFVIQMQSLTLKILNGVFVTTTTIGLLMTLEHFLAHVKLVL